MEGGVVESRHSSERMQRHESMTTSGNSELMVATVCPDCDASILTQYILLGAPMTCESCGHTVVPKVPTGTSYPIIEYELTFGDFMQLLSDPACRPSVSPVLERWFGYRVRPTGDGVEIQTPDGSPAHALDVHLRIQADRQKQYDIYQTAMSLWR